VVVTRRISFGCALLAILLGACRQTVVLDDLSPDGGQSGTGGTGVGPTDASSSDAHCFNTLPLAFEPDTPQVFVALDRSSAMNATLPDAPSQLDAALNALSTVVSSYEPSSGGHNNGNRSPIEFAFLDFPENPLDCSMVQGCCASDYTETTSYQAFVNAEYACNSNNPPPNCGGQSKSRPTADALRKAVTYFVGGGTATHGDQHYVLLVTDGDPSGDCYTVTSSDCGDAQYEIATLNAMEVTTEVVAIGSSATCLNLLAGSEMMTPTVAQTEDALYDALKGIAGTIAQSNCRLTLTQPPSSDQVAVTFGGTRQQEDASSSDNGWSYGSDDTRIILHGSLCANYISWLTNPFGSGLQIYDGCVPSYLGSQPPSSTN
jgi:hypothetical protein